MNKVVLNSNKMRYLVWGAISVLFFIVFFKLWEFDITKPYIYNGKDDFVYGAIAKNAMNGGSYFFNSHLGAPYGMELYYFPLLMQCYIVWCKLIGLFTKNWVIAVNLYYFMTYVLSVCTFFYMCRRIGIKNNLVSYFGGLVFAFSQYHIYRATVHITATSYFIIPLIIVLCYNMAVGKYEEKYSFPKVAELVMISILIGCTDIYYAFFGCFLICIMLVDALLKKRWKTFGVGVGIIMGIALIILICLSPSIIYSLKNGANEQAVSRSPYEAYWVGFQLVSLFLPLKGSQNILARFTKIYTDIQGLPNGEQICNYAGIIGIIGLGYTAYYILFKKDKDEKQELFIKLNIATIFLGTVGGIGLIVAFFITDKVRTYTRVFPYVFAFFIIAVCLLFEKLCEKNKKWFYLLCILILIHFADLSSWSILPDYKNNARKYDADKKFVSELQQFTQDGDYIVQLPYVTGLENYINGIADNCNYHFKGYLLQSQNLGWSYGTLAGTNADTAYREKFDTDSAEQILFFAKQSGYSGIYIDLSMLEESRQHIIQDIQEKLGYVSLVSEDGILYYFNIKDWNIENVSKDYFVAYGEGFYAEEEYEGITWHWSQPESTIKVYSMNEDKVSNIIIELHSFNETMNLHVNARNISSSFCITNQAQTIAIPVEFVNGEAELVFSGESMEYENGTSGRKLSFRINSVVVE